MLRNLVLVISLSCGIIACSTPESIVTAPERAYTVSETQTKNPPIYYPVTPVRSASPGYKEFPSTPGRKVILKRFFFDLPDATLCEVGQALATSFRYKYFCAPSLEDRKYSVNKLLTPYELRDLIEQENNVKVMIDTINGEVRLLSGERIVPKFSK